MKNSNDKQYYRNMVADVREKLASLSEMGHIRAALSIENVDEIAKRIELNNLEELGGAYWRPLFLFISRQSISEILAFERDIDLVVKHSNRTTASQITHYLRAQPRDDRLWAGGLFETFLKSQCLKGKGLTVELDYPLPNGRETDIRIEVGGKPFHLECTVITESDDDREVWDRFMVAKKADEDAVLVRPGQFDSPNSKSPSPYYDTLRFYAKVYDKIAKNLDPKKTQLSEDAPNMLLISFYSPRAPLSPMSPGVGWALDELMADQPKSGARFKDYPPGLTDISLLAWLDFTAKDLNAKSSLDLGKYYEDFQEIVAAPRKMGGIILFESCSLKASRINYNANERCKISHHEIAEFEKLFAVLPEWKSGNR